MTQTVSEKHSDEGVVLHCSVEGAVHPVCPDKLLTQLHRGGLEAGPFDLDVFNIRMLKVKNQ